MKCTLHDLLNDAIQQWVALTGVDPDQTRFKVGEWDIRDTYDQLNEAQRLDTTGLSTAMLLRSFVEWWTENVAFTLNELVNKEGEAKQLVAVTRKLVGTLEEPEIQEPHNEFLDQLRKAVAHYTIDDEDVDKIIENKFEIAYLRRDALLAMDKLRAFQFSYGKPSKDPISYSKNIYQFWNVNSLLKAMAEHPFSCVVLTLIRDPEAYFSYFAFAIRNGGNLIVLTDKDEDEHPMQRSMSRRPDRQFEKRAFRYHFPYQLLKFFEGKDSRIKIPEQKGLVRYNTESIVLGKMNSVGAESMIWLSMMLSLINDRYWHENKRLPCRAYTGEMAVNPTALSAAVKHLEVRRSKTIEIPKYRKEDITTDKLIEAKQWGSPPTRHNEWLEKKFAKKVPENILNLVGDKGLPLLPGQVKDDFFETKLKQFKGLSPVEFGTQRQLIRDAQWTARYNQAKMIKYLAKKEYEKKKDSVLKWFKQRVLDNRSFLLRSVALGMLKAVMQGRHRRHSWDHSNEREYNILKLWWDPKGELSFYGEGVILLGGWAKVGRWGGHRTCCVTGKKASIFARFRLMAPRALAIVAGCRVKDMPEPLQHYYENEPYGGNCILDRLDPMDWVIENPWKGLHLEVVVCLSKRGFNQLRKEHGHPPFVQEDWERIRYK